MLNERKKIRVLLSFVGTNDMGKLAGKDEILNGKFNEIRISLEVFNNFDQLL